MRIHAFVFLFILSIVRGKFLNVLLDGGFDYGLFWIDLYTGSDSQKTRVHVDTGSNLLILEARTCSSCNPYNKGYDESTSTSSMPITCTSPKCSSNSCYSSGCVFSSICSSGKCCARTRPTHCGFYVAFGDGSQAEGYLTQEQFVLKSMSSSDSFPSVLTSFGVINMEAGNWDESTDGLMGLAYSSLNCSPTCYNTYMDDFYQQYKSDGYKDIFSMCFSDKKGVLTFGGIDESMYLSLNSVSDGSATKGQSLYDIDLLAQSFYAISMNKMTIDDTNIFSSRTPFILDSGTTLMLVVPSIFNAIVDFFKKNYSFLPGVANGEIFGDASLLSPPDSRWPTLHFHFDRVKVSLPASVYFLPFKYRSSTLYMFGIRENSYNNLLGDTFMRGFFIVHDRDADIIRIGLPSSNCFVTQYGQLNDSPLPPDDDPFDYTTIVWIIVIAVCVLVLCYAFVTMRKKPNAVPTSRQLPVQKQKPPPPPPKPASKDMVVGRGSMDSLNPSMDAVAPSPAQPLNTQYQKHPDAPGSFGLPKASLMSGGVGDEGFPVYYARPVEPR